MGADGAADTVQSSEPLECSAHTAILFETAQKDILADSQWADQIKFLIDDAYRRKA